MTPEGKRREVRAARRLEEEVGQEPQRHGGLSLPAQPWAPFLLAPAASAGMAMQPGCSAYVLTPGCGHSRPLSRL